MDDFFTVSPEPKISDTPEIGEAPETSAAPETSEAPRNTEAPANSDEPVESTEAAPRPASLIPIDSGLWPWIGDAAALVAVLIITVTVLAIQGRKRKNVKKKNDTTPAEISRTERPGQPAPPVAPVQPVPPVQLVTPVQPMTPVQPAPPVPPGAVPQVGKLHQHGARASQQDCFSVSPTNLIHSFGLLAVVADGMGGLADGDKVSQAAVTAMMNGFYAAQGRPEEVLLSLLGQANSEVNRLLGPDGYGKSGSTLVAGLVRDGKFYTLSVGDSRVCLYRGGVLYQLNREHMGG